MKKKNPKLCLIIPCYNEETTIPLTYNMFLQKLEQLINEKKITKNSSILFVNDGSKDNTWKIIKKLSTNYNAIKGLSLSKNYGHQNALLAGLMEAKNNYDITISVDCDGQDDINAIDEMINEYTKGNEIVYGVRSSREKDSFFKRTTAELYYFLMIKMGVGIIFNHADYRLVSKRVINELQCYKEVNLFLRGIFPTIGFKSSIVYYQREKRIAGSSHYTLGKMLALAIDGITSFSVKPIHYITFFGVIVAFFSFAVFIWSFIGKITNKTIANGWTSIVCLLCFIGGIQLISLGIIGEYIGKIYLETKQRPRFIISERTR